MGKKDVYQFDYLDDNERLADQVNGALFHGRQVVRPEELEPEKIMDGMVRGVSMNCLISTMR